MMPITFLLKNSKAKDVTNQKNLDVRRVESFKPYDSILVNNSKESQEKEKNDGRKNNCGWLKRQSYTIVYKLKFLEEVIQCMESDEFPEIKNPTLYF